MNNEYKEQGYTRAEQEQEIQRKIVSEIEWHYEKTGETIDLYELLNKIEIELASEGWNEEAMEYAEEIAEDLHDQESAKIIDIITSANTPDPQAGQNFYDTQI